MKFTEFLIEGDEASRRKMNARSKHRKLAKKLGVTMADVEAMTDQELKTILSKIGKHDEVPNSMFDPTELKKGIETEREHTNSRLAATLIAKDHCSEVPDYYTRLDKMEKEAKKFWKNK